MSYGKSYPGAYDDPYGSSRGSRSGSNSNANGNYSASDYYGNTGGLDRYGGGGGGSLSQGGRSSGAGSGLSSTVRGVFKSDKTDAALAEHIKKALSAEEVAPKQKHVRECILYTWDVKGSGSLWLGLKGYPMYGDEVVTFKGLILVHKVMNGGHARALKDLANDYGWLENLGRGVGGFRGGYGGLIKTYLQFLTQKLDYHKNHPEYTGNFDYQEYVTLKGVEDPNEGFETINDLLNLLKRSYSMGEAVFNSFRAGAGNECRIAAL
ncbi:sla2 Src-like adaptor 2, partial [Rhizoclosmatium hyalinum]